MTLNQHCFKLVCLLGNDWAPREESGQHAYPTSLISLCCALSGLLWDPSFLWLIRMHWVHFVLLILPCGGSYDEKRAIMPYLNGESRDQSVHFTNWLGPLLPTFGFNGNCRIYWQTGKTLISLQKCTGWSVSSMFLFGIRALFCNVYHTYHIYHIYCKNLDQQAWANSADPDQILWHLVIKLFSCSTLLSI